MLDRRIANHRWCLLLLSITALGFPFASFSQTYTSYVTGSWDTFLASDGFAYYPGEGLDPPVQTIPMSQMLYNTGSCGATTSPGGNPCTQAIGLGRQDGYAYLVGFWNRSGVWQPEGILPGQSTKFSQLVVDQGWGNDGGFWSGGGFTTVYTSNFLQVVGLGANDGLAYLAAFQDPNGTWHSAGILPGQSIPFAQLYMVHGNSGKLQVIGRAVSDNRLYLTAYQDNNGSWHAAGLLPGQTPVSSAVAVVTGNPDCVQVLTLGPDGYIYLPDWQDANGTWHAAGILPGQSIPLENVVAASIQVGNAVAGTDWTYQVIVGGLGANDHIFHVTNWQDANGTWHAYDASSLQVQIPQVPMAQVYVNSHLGDALSLNAVFYGISQNNGHVYVLAADGGGTGGTWYGGYDTTPNGFPVMPGASALNSTSTTVTTGSAFTLSWSVPSGSINHYTLAMSENGGALTTTTIAPNVTSQTYTKTAGKGNTNVFDYEIQACSTADQSVCGAWSNTVEVDVNGAPGGGGGCPRC